jgi:putative DNA primase/helicase
VSIIDRLHEAGIDPSGLDLTNTAAFQRLRLTGSKKKSAWVKVHQVDPLVASLGNWKAGISETYAEASKRQRRTFFRSAPTAKKDANDDHRIAARKAWSQWATAAEADPVHPYLAGKKILPHGIRQFGELLLIPMVDEFERLHSLQRINATGEKRFFPGGRVGGMHYLIGEVSDRLLLCEGFATGATLHEATGLPVAVCFSAGNLQPTGYALRRIFPRQRFTYAGDNDQTAGNPGLTSARKAAESTGDDLMVPRFNSDSGTDWNDYSQLYGNDAIAGWFA